MARMMQPPNAQGSLNVLFRSNSFFWRDKGTSPVRQKFFGVAKKHEKVPFATF